MELLGHILTKEGMKPNPNKIKVVQNLELPKPEKQIKAFPGLTGYFRKFVKNYAKKGAKINTKDTTYV